MQVEFISKSGFVHKALFVSLLLQMVPRFQHFKTSFADQLQPYCYW